MKKFFRKNKKVLTIVGVILATTLIVGIVAASTNIIGKISNSNIGGLRERNKDNVFDVSSYESLNNTRQDGLKITVDDDGVIILNGKATKDGALQLLYDKPIQYDRFYTLSGVIDGSMDTYYLEHNVINTPTLNFSYTDDPLVIKSGGNLNVRVVYKEGTEFNNVKIYPTLGIDEVTSFYE